MKKTGWGAVSGAAHGSEQVVFSLVRFSLRQHELDAGLYREVIAAQNRDRGERTVLALRAPALLVARVLFALQRLAAHRRREHAARAPAPDFLAREVLDHEIVGLPIGEAQLQHFRGVVFYVEREAELVRVVVGSGD